MPSKRMTLLNAIKAELLAITAGGTYNYTPAEVAYKFKLWDECAAFPAYFISAGSGGPPPEELKDRHRIRVLNVSIKGNVYAPDDPTTALNNAITDVEKAVFADPTHGGLALRTDLDGEPDTDDGYLGTFGYGYFDMRLSIRYQDIY